MTVCIPNGHVGMAMFIQNIDGDQEPTRTTMTTMTVSKGQQPLSTLVLFLIFLLLQDKEEEKEVAVDSRCCFTESEEQHQEQLQSLKQVFQTVGVLMSCPYA